MSLDVSDLRPTIVPKSDQLNADQLVAGPMTVTVTEVRVSSSDDQPVVVHYEGENGRPFKPCKTMRKVLVFAWGEDGRKWPGRSMTLYNDPSVKFGGTDVGGIRISHMSDIERDVQVSLTATKGKKALHVIKVLRAPKLSDVLAAIESAANREGMDKAKAMVMQLLSQADIEQAKAAYSARAKVLKAKASAPTTEPTLADRIAAAADLQTLQALGEEMDNLPDSPEKEELAQALLARENAITG